MKIQRLEAHDRLISLNKEQANTISQGASDCLRINKLSLALQEYSPYVYIFGHPRTHEDGVTQRMLWQPRLTRPFAQTNSYLFRAVSKSDILEVIWLLPPREMWSQYEKGKVCESEIVMESIDKFINHREVLEAPHIDDLVDSKIAKIYDLIEKSKESIS